MTWVGFHPATLSIVKGEERLRQYRSSPNAQRGSCGLCVSQIFFQSDRWPDEIHVTRASLPDELDLKPQSHYFFDDRAPWTEVHDELPRYGGLTGTEKGLI